MANMELTGSFEGMRASEFSRIEETREITQLDAFRSKFVPSDRPDRLKNRQSIQRPDISVMQSISEQSAMDVRDANDIMQLLPEIELIEEILVSSILSPKDMVSENLTYGLRSDMYTSEIAAKFIDVIRDHFENTGILKSMLSDILKDCLFRKGSYPVAIIPESSVDDAINSRCTFSMESIRSDWDGRLGGFRTLGFLGNPDQSKQSNLSMEAVLRGTSAEYTDIIGPLGVRIVDNPNVLKFPLLHEKIKADSERNVLRRAGYASESLSDSIGKSQSFYRSRQFSYTPVHTIKTKEQTSRRSVGHPLVMTLPHESVIVVHRPGNPRQHVGYFVMIDQSGNPINTTQFRDYYQEMQSTLNGNTGLGSMQQNTISKEIRGLYTNMFGMSGGGQSERIELDRLYADIMERELINRYRNGAGGGEAELSRDMAIYQAMLGRALKNMQTQMLYIPASLLVYFAFDYDDHGIGRSLVTKSKILSGLRSMLTFADTHGSIMNSIPMKRIKITLEENDPDPSGTVNSLLHEYYRVNGYRFPMGESNPGVMLDYLQRASTSVEVTGNSGYPGTAFDVDDTTVSRARPDSDLSENLKRRHIQSFGLTPEVLDAASGADFAATVNQNNLLQNRRTKKYQDQYTPQLERFVRMYVVNSEELMNELRRILKESFHKLTGEEKEAVEEAKIQRKAAIAASAKLTEAPKSGGEPVQVKNPVRTETLNERQYSKRRQAMELIIKESGYDALILDFLEALELKFPEPDNLEMRLKTEMINEYASALDAVLPSIIDNEFMTSESMGDVISERVEGIRSAYKALLLRRFIQNNNILPEVMEIAKWDEEDGSSLDLLKEIQEYNNTVAKSVLSYALQAKTDKQRRQSAEQLLDADEDSGGSSDSGGDYGSSDNVDSGDSGSDPFGDDGFGGDSGGDEESGDTGDTGSEEETKEE